MNRQLKMLEELVKELDYDIYCSLFVNPEEPELATEQINRLIEIIKNHYND